MSLDALTAVWKHSEQKGGDLLVLLALADYADDMDCVWPSVETLASKARLTSRHIRRILRRLESAGEIELLESGGLDGGRGRAATYRIVVADKMSARTNAVGNPDIDSSETRTPTSPQPLKEPLEPPGAPRAREAQLPPLEQARDIYRSLTSNEKAVLRAVVEVAQAKNATVGWRVTTVLEACARFPDRDLEAEANAFRFYWVEGLGENRPIKNPASTWRNWLARAPSADTRRRAVRRPGRDREAKAERAQRDLEAITRLKGAT